MAAITRRRPDGEDRGRLTVALPPRAPAAASESEAKVSSSLAARDLKVACACSTAGGSTSGSGTSSTTYTSSRGSVLSSELDLQLLFIDAEEKAKRREFYHGDGDIAALERWLYETGVGWVLGVPDYPSAWTRLLRAQRNILTERWIRTITEKLQTLLGMRDALLRAASGGIPLCFDLRSLFSEKERRLEEAIWNTMEKVRTSILSDGDDNNEWGIQTPQGSPDTCKVTRSLVTYIGSLWNNYWRLNRIVRAAAELGSYVPNRDIIRSFLLSTEQDETDPLTSLALEMVFSLEVKLAKRSESFPDHSLRFLFLINNTHFIWQHLHPLFSMKYHTEVLAPKIEGYIQKYLRSSWAPVMSCLYNHTPRWFRKNSPLPKFDSKFRKTYSVHKLWKVPDPKLRTRLRKAIVEEVVPGLTGYLEDNNITSPGVTPQEREKMLLELFEG